MFTFDSELVEGDWLTYMNKQNYMIDKNKLETSIEGSIERKEKYTFYGRGGGGEKNTINFFLGWFTCFNSKSRIQVDLTYLSLNSKYIKRAPFQISSYNEKEFPNEDPNYGPIIYKRLVMSFLTSSILKHHHPLHIYL